MNRPIVIVDPRSSGTELAPTFKSRGIPSIAVAFKPIKNRLGLGFGTEVRTSDFMDIIYEDKNIVEVLKKYNPLAIIPGAEAGVPLAHRLSTELTPEFANDPLKAVNRIHKAQMQSALNDAGVPSLKTLNTSSEREVEIWIKENDFSDSPLIFKPPMSAGSDKVFHISPNEDWKRAFYEILENPSNITGHDNKTVVVQEMAVGTEFAVGTVSSKGRHYLAHLIKYNKISFNGRETIYDYVEFVPFEIEKYGNLFQYTTQVLDVLGVKFGAAHNEIILTKNGPRLIESVPRMCGGPVVGFAREATGSSQADKLAEIFSQGDVKTKDYTFKKSVVPVFLKSPNSGQVANAEIFDDLSKLTTLHKKFIWFKNGDEIPKTVDYLTSIGIIALSGDRNKIFSDYEKIRYLESKLIINTV